MASLIAGETFLEHIRANASAVVAHVRGASSHTVTGLEGDEDNCWVLQADTATWTPGNYTVGIFVTCAADGRKFYQRQYSLTVKPSLSAMTGATDIRSDAEKMVANIEAMLAGNASSGVRRYKINNRELERYSAGELLQLLSYWRNRVKIEQRKAQGFSALGPNIRVRF